MTSVLSIARVKARWQGLSPLTRGLVWFAILSSFILPLALAGLTDGRTSLHHLRHVLIWQIFGDSWQPVVAAIDFLSVYPDSPVYTALFLDNHVRFQYPPTSLLLIEPLYRLPDVTSDPNFWVNALCAVALLSNIAVVAAIFFRVLDRHAAAFAPRSPLDKTALAAVLAALTLTFTPVISSVDVGQVQAWINFAFAAAVLAWLGDRKSVAGVLIGLICLFKPQLGLLLVWAVFRREWRFAAAMVITGAIFGILSLAVYGLAQHLNYLEILGYLSRHGESYWWNQSFMGLFHRVLFNGANTEADAAAVALDDSEFLPPYNAWVYAGTLATSAVMIGLALFWRRGEHKRASLIDFMIASLTFTIASPIAWVYHYGIAMPIFAVALPMALAEPKIARYRLLWLGLAFVLLSERFDVTQRLADTRLNVLESTFLFGALLLLWYLYRLRHVLADRRPDAVAKAPGTAAPALAAGR